MYVNSYKKSPQKTAIFFHFSSFPPHRNTLVRTGRKLCKFLYKNLVRLEISFAQSVCFAYSLLHPKLCCFIPIMRPSFLLSEIFFFPLPLHPFSRCRPYPEKQHLPPECLRQAPASELPLSDFLSEEPHSPPQIDLR